MNMNTRIQWIGFSVSLIVGLATIQSSAAVTVLDSCEDAVYTIESLSTGESITFTNPTDHTEGAKSLQISYNYTAEGAWYKNASVTKTFSSPVDLRGLESFSFDAQIPSSNPAFILLMVLTDDQGYQNLFMLSNLFSASTSGFVTQELRFDELQKNEWKNMGRAINLAKISKISFNIENQGDLTSPGTLVFSVDNVRFTKGGGLLREIVIEDFESYSDNSALNAKWGVATSSTSESLETTAPYSGAKSLRLSATLSAKWTGYYTEYSFTSPQDFSGASYMKLSVYGNAAFASLNCTPLLYLVDGAGNRLVAYTWGWGNLNQWSEMYLPFEAAASYDASWSCWREDDWDVGGVSGVCNKTDIRKLWLSIVTQGDGTYPVNSSILFDNIIVGAQTTPSSVNEWPLY